MKQPVWKTAAGSLGTTTSSNTLYSKQLEADAQLPAVFVTYQLISGSLPSGLTISTSGLISGVLPASSTTVTNTFVIRATDNYSNIADRTFSITYSGTAVPSFITPAGSLTPDGILDSTWTSIQIEYKNPVSTNPVIIRKTQGTLPPGLEINDYGLIRGYAEPPIINVNKPSVVTNAIATSSANNTVTCLSTVNFFPGRPIIFTGSVFGSIESGKTYYVKSVLNGTTFTLSYVVNGSTVPLADGVGYMIATLPGISTGEPTNESYSFTLKIESPLGSVSQNYSIQVINQNTPVNQNGPGNPPNTRPPAIFNTRPETYNIAANVDEYGYYVLPPDGHGNTYTPNTAALIGTFTSDNILDFRILGHDFDSNMLEYHYSNLPLGLVGDTDTGWITGNPVIASPSISQFGFSVYVSKKDNVNIVSDTFNFSFRIRNDIQGDIVWITPENMGTVYNGITSMEYIEAKCDVPLNYRLISGTLPPNLTLLPNGELSGIVSFQPADTIQNLDTTANFTFTVEAYSEVYPVITATRTFTLGVYQEFNVPFDTVYCKCTPAINDRLLIKSLLSDNSLIPTDYLYRADDPYFGKATSVIYDHIYGINANDLDAYVAAISEKNHYFRNITLGEIKTAIARNELTGETIYEVVYSDVIDNLVAYNEIDEYSIENQSNIITPQGESVAKEVYWPRLIPLSLGPWYDSSTSLYTSYISNNQVAEFYVTRTEAATNYIYCYSTSGLQKNDMVVFTSPTVGNIVRNTTYYVANVVSPDIFQISASLNGPVFQLADASNNGNPLMIYNAWSPPIDYYTSLTPGFARILYPNSLPNMRQQVVNVLGQNQNYHLLPLWMTSQQKNGSTLGYTPAWVIAYCKPGTTTLNGNTVSYAEYIQYQIQNNWKSSSGTVQTLNTINFELDRFTVNKSATYNYDNTLSPAAFSQLPGATPTPNPIDSKDFYVLFPRETILPDHTQYKH